MQPGTNLRQLRQTANLTLDQVVAALNRGLSKEQTDQKVTSKQIRNWEAAKGKPVLTPAQTKQLLEIYNLTDLKELSLAMQSTQKQAGKPEDPAEEPEAVAEVAEEPAEEPEDPAEEPEAVAEAAEEPAEESEEPTEEAETATEEAEEPVEETEDPAEEAKESTEEPEA